MKIFVKLFMMIVLSHQLFSFGLDEIAKNFAHKDFQGEFVGKRESQSLQLYPPVFGQFELKSTGLTLMVKSPLSMGIKISNGIYMQNSTGWQEIPLAIDKRLLLELLKMNFSTLKKYFTLQINGTQKYWELTLIPKEEDIKKRIKEIKINGGTFIQSIFIKEVNGDQNQVVLKNVKFYDKK